MSPQRLALLGAIISTIVALWSGMNAIGHSITQNHGRCCHFHPLIDRDLKEMSQAIDFDNAACSVGLAAWAPESGVRAEFERDVLSRLSDRVATSAAKRWAADHEGAATDFLACAAAFAALATLQTITWWRLRSENA